MADRRETEARVSSRAAVSADVAHNPEPQTTMYWQGTPVSVPNDSIPKFQAQGFLLHKPEDLAALVGEVDLLAKDVTRSAAAFADQVLADQVIGTEEQAELRVLQVAMTKLYSRLQDMINVAQQNYPVREQGETAKETAARLAADEEHKAAGERARVEEKDDTGLVAVALEPKE